MTESINLVLDKSIIEKLDIIANALQLSRENTLRQAILDFIEMKDLEEDVKIGLHDIKTGNIQTNETVNTYFINKRNILSGQIQN